MKISSKLFRKEGKFMKIDRMSVKIIKISDGNVELEVWTESKLTKQQIYPNLSQNFYLTEGQSLHLEFNENFKAKQRTKIS